MVHDPHRDDGPADRPDDGSNDGLWGWAQDVPAQDFPVRDVPVPSWGAQIDPRGRDPTGAAPPRRPLVPILVVLLVALVAFGAVLVIQRGDSTTAASSQTSSTDTTESTSALEPTGALEPTRTTATVDTESAATSELQALRDGDLMTVSLDASWVAQLASKYVGIVDPEQTTQDGGHVFGAVDILAEHRRLRDGDNLGARVVLLLSTDYGKRQLVNGNPLWVTFALGDFGSAAGVDAWCHQRFPQLSSTQLTNACTARRLYPPE